MVSACLIKDEDAQTILKRDTKYLIDETLTAVIEIFQGHAIEEWSESEVKLLNNYRRFSNSHFFHRREKDGKLLIEYSDAICLLKEYYASNTYGGPLKNRIVEEQRDNEEFVEKKFRSDYDRQCDKERKILEILGDTRNKEFGHSIEESNMGEIYMWIRQLMKYLDCFSGYRMQVLSEYDSQFGKAENQESLDGYFSKASDLKEKCFASKENYKEFRFGKNTYKISKDDKDDFELLINDMARNWNRGISYLKNTRTCNAFHEMLEEYYDDYDKVMDFDEKHESFLKTSNNSIDESIIYMSLIYHLFPSLSGLYWKGMLYSESYFASLVLQVLTRHPNKFTFEEKKDTLKYRIKNIQEWNETGDKAKGIGIDIILLCKEHILTKYFNGHHDYDGIVFAESFEKAMVLCENDEYIRNNYDEIMITILSLIAHMKGKITYMLPIAFIDEEGNKNYKTFRNPDEFRKYFVKYISEESDVEEIAKFVYSVRDDINLKWFLGKVKVESGKES